MNGALSPIDALDGIVGSSVVERQLEYGEKTITIYVRKMSGAEADDFAFAIMGKDGKMDMTKAKGQSAKQIAAALCDAQGGRIANAAKIDTYPSDLKQKLQAICNEVNGGNAPASEAANDSGTP